MRRGPTGWGGGKPSPGGGRCLLIACRGRSLQQPVPTGRGGPGALPSWWPLLRHVLPGLFYPSTPSSRHAR